MIRAARSVVAMLAFAALATGCTVGQVCTESIAPYSSRESVLGTATIEKCVGGHCMSMRSAVGVRLVFDLPDAAGSFTLEELGAKTCELDSSAGGDLECAPAEGTVIVREVHPPERGKPVGRFDADVVVTTEVLGGPATIDYRERKTESCQDETWPDIGPIPMGPR